MLKKEDYEPGLWTEEKNLTVEETRLPFTVGTGRCDSSSGRKTGKYLWNTGSSCPE